MKRQIQIHPIPKGLNHSACIGFHALHLRGIPKGFRSFSPGLRGRSYPGARIGKDKNPNGVSAFGAGICEAATPLGLLLLTHPTQGSSLLATLGFATQSRWDCHVVKVKRQEHRSLSSLPYPCLSVCICGFSGWENSFVTFVPFCKKSIAPRR